MELCLIERIRYFRSGIASLLGHERRGIRSQATGRGESMACGSDHVGMEALIAAPISPVCGASRDLLIADGAAMTENNRRAAVDQASGIGTHFWLVVFIGLYWAYVILWNERHNQNGRSGHFGSGLLPGTAERSVTNQAPVIATVDRTEFDEEDFIAYAGKAYEFILRNFAEGNPEVLVDIVSPGVFEVFSREIERRNAAGEKMSLAFAALNDTKIVERDFGAEFAEVKVRFSAEIFVSDLVSTGEGFDEGPTRLMNAVDLWTFHHPGGSSSPGWVLTATDTE